MQPTSTPSTDGFGLGGSTTKKSNRPVSPRSPERSFRARINVSSRSNTNVFSVLRERVEAGSNTFVRLNEEPTPRKRRGHDVVVVAAAATGALASPSSSWGVLKCLYPKQSALLRRKSVSENSNLLRCRC